MKIYIAGPMQGYKDFNFPAFDAAEQYCYEKLHYEGVFNPAKKDREIHGDQFGKGTEGNLKQVPEFNLRAALAVDLSWICDYADAIYMLKGWENSKGARAEHALAVALDLKILYESA